jgi:hypothetical protein
MLIFGCGWHACRVRGNCSRHGCLYRGPGRAYRQASLRDTSADLQLLAMNVYVRRRCDNALCRTGVGNRFNCPHPAEVAILVEEPSSATAFPDLHSPVIAVAGNCENKCNRSRHNHAAQISNEECAYHFVSLHFHCSLIEARRRADCLFDRD